MASLGNIKGNKGIFRLLPVILFFVVTLSGVVRIFTFSIGINLYDLHDYIEGVFWAEATLRSGSVISPEYIYYYIVPFGSNLLIAPFVHLLGPCFLANELGMLLFYIIFIAVLLRLAAAIYDDWRSRLIFSSITSLFIFTYVGDNLLHHLLCYGIGFVCFLGLLSCIVNISKGRSFRKNIIWMIIFCLWSSLNGAASATLSVLPVLAAVAYSGFRHKTLLSKKNLKIFIFTSSPTLIGFLIYKYLDMRALSQHLYEDRFFLASAEDLANSLTTGLLKRYLQNFNYDPGKITILSLSGISAVIMLFLAIAVIAVPALLYRKSGSVYLSPTVNNETNCTILTANAVVIGICIAQFVFFTKDTGRFLFNGILSLFLLSSFGLANLKDKNKLHLYLVPVLCLALALLGKMFVHSIPYGNEKKEEFIHLNEFFNEANLSRGYTFHRRYKAIELISKGKNTNSVIKYDEKTAKLFVVPDRIFIDEAQKPAGTDSFYIIRLNKEGSPQDYGSIIYPEETVDPVQSLLEENCIDVFPFENIDVYIFDIEKWDTLFTVVSLDDYLS